MQGSVLGAKNDSGLLGLQPRGTGLSLGGSCSVVVGIGSGTQEPSPLPEEGRMGPLETTTLSLTLKVKWTGSSCFEQERSKPQARPGSTQRYCYLLEGALGAPGTVFHWPFPS